MKYLPFVFLLCGSASAQQFVEQPDLVPGPVVWSEAAVVLDANDDGQPDLLFVNARGFLVPGDFGDSADPLPPTLLIHQGVQNGQPVFADETAQYFPASFEIHGKAAAVADYDGDGHDDIAFAVAFGDQQRLFRKNPTTGVYDDETFRLPALVINSFGVSAGDLDDDGDLDLVFTDAGPNSATQPGGLTRMLLNDGTGNFVDESARLNATEKIGAQNAKLVDIDGDLDIDVIVDGKSPRTHVHFNDGAANFTLDLSIVPKAESSFAYGAYEVEWGDLDNDDDIDGLLMNFAPADTGVVNADAPIRNRLMESGELTLRALTTYMFGNNGEDENDFVFMDADDDGDLDVLIAVLPFGGAPGEKLFMNNGTFGPGILTQVPNAITKFQDASLDMVVADFDFDGDYDMVTAQGEFMLFQDFTNRYYENTGPADSTAPRVPRVTVLPATVSAAEAQAGLTVRAWVQDSVIDDNKPYESASLEWTVTKGAAVEPASADMMYAGGAIHRGVLNVAPTAEGLIGASVDVEVAATDGPGNVGFSASQSFVVCGVEGPYCTAKTNSQGCVPMIASSGSPSTTDPSVFDVSASNVLNNKNGLLFYGYQGRAALPFLEGTLCVQPPLRRLPIQNSGGNLPPDDCSGQYSFDFNALIQSGSDPFLVAGQRVNAQWWSRDPALADGSGAGLSDGLEFWICD